MLGRRPKELFEVMGNRSSGESANLQPRARARTPRWSGTPIVVLAGPEAPCAPEPLDLSTEPTETLPAVGQPLCAEPDSPAAEPAVSTGPVVGEPATVEPVGAEAPPRRRFVSLDPPPSSRRLPRARPAPRAPAAEPRGSALQAPIPPNATQSAPSTWVGELALWGSQTLNLRRDTLLVVLAILVVSLLLAFLFGQKLGEVGAAPPASGQVETLEQAPLLGRSDPAAPAEPTPQGNPPGLGPACTSAASVALGGRLQLTLWL